MPLSSVQSVRVETVKKSSAENEQLATTYTPTLRLSAGGAEPASEHLVEWHDAEKARRFVEWLQDKLLSKPPPVRPLAGKF